MGYSMVYDPNMGNSYVMQNMPMVNGVQVLPMAMFSQLPMQSVPGVSNVPNLSGMSAMPGVSNVPTTPGSPNVSNVPGVPLQSVPGVPMQGVQGVPLQNVPGMPLQSVPGVPMQGVQGMPLQGVPGMPMQGVQGVPGMPMQGAPGMVTPGNVATTNPTSPGHSAEDRGEGAALSSGENGQASAFPEETEPHEDAEEMLGPEDPVDRYKEKLEYGATMSLQTMGGPAYRDPTLRPMPRSYEMGYPQENGAGMGNRMAYSKKCRQPKERGGMNRQVRGANRSGHENGAYGEMSDPKPRRNAKQQGMSDGQYRNYAQKGYSSQRQVQGKYNNRMKAGTDAFSDANRRDGGNRMRQREGNTQQHDAY